ncbi:isoprenylcysteine carboxyl methyltransferase family protein [Pontibacillus marinus]|uniref:isoprenylcysteine carboxyl methyltransferase family protein n=1 Tax=Pontibacillus marinus TaxID=273164 RepID=UPI00041E281B|nr:isoprenylcysteine carboxylmethyltransferase family protein [Pontibacillus marinus]
MNVIFIIIFLLIVLQRIVEVIIAKQNEKWMKNRGAIEHHSDHYKWIVLVHTLFFFSIMIEAFGEELVLNQWKGLLLLLFVCAQAFRVWCLVSLGRYWNTKIIVLPEAELVTRGPYKFMKHPNYVVVAIEFILIPLLFNAYATAFIFPILHGVLMKIRIPYEEKALSRDELKSN